MEGVSYGYDQPMQTKSGAVENLDQHLEELDAAINELERIVAPVRSQYASEKVLSEPHPEPSTALRGRIERLRHLTNRLRLVTGEIDL